METLAEADRLTEQNFQRGFLIDEELMGGVTEHPEQRGLFVAFVLRHTTGEYLGYEPFTDARSAIEKINSVVRPWKFEKSSGCGGCADGACGKGKCGKSGGGCADGVCPT